ncbi:hypothetical protein GOP47_0011386 [Adiantum capillus-veneris]|uniref:Sodium/hydrogen exchanger n=1 Tax=Adiantum capillus-veneris TaxID=13818 RepID=A0A9D4ZFC7_ADICA|nr:hypothetical protein GOP47_0011386 [Adiantum capillus-veneris]
MTINSINGSFARMLSSTATQTAVATPLKVFYLSDTSDYSLVVSITLMVTLLCVCMVIGHLFEENRWVNESITALILGLFAGFIVLISTQGNNSHVLQFDEELFFIYLLPPIIFNAGFQVKKKQFFRNFVAIVLFGVIGVFISFGIIAAGSGLIFPLFNLEGLGIRDFLALGVIFSATDSVCTLQVLNQDETPLLYSLVFGEGVVNDATSVVLYRAVENLDLSEVDALAILQILGEFIYLFLTSTLLGIAVGLLSAYVIKKLYFGRHSTDREIAVMILMAYLSYILAELLYLSGILTVFFCGIVMSHYTWHNVTESSRITTRHTFATLSFIAETFIFLYVGMDALDKDKWDMTEVSISTSIGLCATLIALVLVGRAAFVIPLSAASNLARRGVGTEISFRQQIIIWWAGLMRGAVSMALAYKKFTANSAIYATMITCTILVVLFSTVVFGLLTKPLLRWLIHPHITDVLEPETPKVPRVSSGDMNISLLEDGEPAHHPNATSKDRVLDRSSSTVHHLWRKFDDSFMRPVFGGRGFVLPFHRSHNGEVQDSRSSDHFDHEG